MKITKIYCDRCGRDTTEEYGRIKLMNSSNDIIVSHPALPGAYIHEKDFCFDCLNKIISFAINRQDAEGEETLAEPVEAEPEPKIHKGGCVKGQRILSPTRKDIVSQMVLEKRTDREIAEATDMPVDKITAYIERNGLRQLFVHDEPKKPDPPVRTTSSGMVFSE